MERRRKSVLLLHRAVMLLNTSGFDLHAGLRCLFIRGIPARLIKISARKKKDAINLFLVINFRMIAKITANSPVVLIGQPWRRGQQEIFFKKNGLWAKQQLLKCTFLGRRLHHGLRRKTSRQCEVFLIADVTKGRQIFLILFELGWNAIRIQHHKNLKN